MMSAVVPGTSQRMALLRLNIRRRQRRTSTPTANGSDTTPAVTIPTTTLIITGNTDALPAASAVATFGIWPEAAPTASGSAASISVWLLMTLASAATGSGTAMTSSFTKIPTTTAGTWLTTSDWVLTSTSCTLEPERRTANPVEQPPLLGSAKLKRAVPTGYGNFLASHLTSSQILVITIRSFRTGLGVCQFGGNSTARG